MLENENTVPTKKPVITKRRLKLDTENYKVS